MTRSTPTPAAHGTPHRAEAPARTRLAPSPTGALHLGNLRTFVVNWVLARQSGWRILLRIEDLDGPRIRAGAEQEAIELLEWIGLDWDEGPLRQSDDLDPYAEAMIHLATRALAYPCDLTRTEIEAAAAAPQEGTGEVRFPASLRPTLEPRAFDAAARTSSWRVVVGDEAFPFDDACAGPQRTAPAESVGDFIVWTKRAQPSYQLAVVVDDARQGVTHVVRGDDLLDSTARQLLLYDALGLTAPRAWWHLPLVVGPDGRRLAKRHGDTRTRRYRAAGVPPERVLGLLARWSGCDGADPDDPRAPRRAMDLSEFLGRFDPATMPRTPVLCRPEDDAWLLGSD